MARILQKQGFETPVRTHKGDLVCKNCRKVSGREQKGYKRPSRISTTSWAEASLPDSSSMERRMVRPKVSAK